MLKKWLTIMILSIHILIISSLGINEVKADQGEGQFPFEVNIILPENQIAPKSYYHIAAKPGETLKLEAEISNITDEAVELLARPLNAYSSSSGIVYQEEQRVNGDQQRIDDERFALARQIVVEPAFQLKPGERIRVPITVRVPDIEGGATLLGGIRFMVFEGVQDISNEQEESRLMLDKYLALDTAVQIDIAGEQVPAELKVGNVELGDQLTLAFDMSIESARIENISGTYTVRSETNDELFSGTIEAFNMAPHTSFSSYYIPWTGDKVESGRYVLELEMNVSGTESRLSKSFTLGNEDIQEAVEEGNVPEVVVNSGVPVWVWILVVFLIVSLLIVIVLLFRRQKTTKS